MCAVAAATRKLIQRLHRQLPTKAYGPLSLHRSRIVVTPRDSWYIGGSGASLSIAVGAGIGPEGAPVGRRGRGRALSGSCFWAKDNTSQDRACQPMTQPSSSECNGGMTLSSKLYLGKQTKRSAFLL